VDAAVEEPAHDLGPAVLAGMDERLSHDLLRITGRRQPRRKACAGVGEVGRADAASGRRLPSASKQARTRSSRPQAAYVQSACGTIPCSASRSTTSVVSW
jgi:hypothetical protein